MPVDRDLIKRLSAIGSTAGCLLAKRRIANLRTALACTTLATCFVLVPTGEAFAASKETAPPRLNKVHLVRTTIGCGSLGELLHVSEIIVDHGLEAARADPASQDCHIITSFRGPVIEESGRAICVLGFGNTRCLWFAAKYFKPTDH
jgi:hypothetical protein